MGRMKQFLHAKRAGASPRKSFVPVGEDGPHEAEVIGGDMMMNTAAAASSEATAAAAMPSLESNGTSESDGLLITSVSRSGSSDATNDSSRTGGSLRGLTMRGGSAVRLGRARDRSKSPMPMPMPSLRISRSAGNSKGEKRQQQQQQRSGLPIHLTPSSRPDPSRTASPVDLDVTPPPTPLEQNRFDFATDVAQRGTLVSKDKNRTLEYLSPATAASNNLFSPTANSEGSAPSPLISPAGALGVARPTDVINAEPTRSIASNAAGASLTPARKPPQGSRPPAHPIPTSHSKSLAATKLASPNLKAKATTGAPAAYADKCDTRSSSPFRNSSPQQNRHTNTNNLSSSMSVGSARSANSASSKKSIAMLAVDSNCIAGEFREVQITLSDSRSFDSAEDDTSGRGDGVGTEEDLAFGLDPRNLNQSEEGDDYGDEKFADQFDYVARTVEEDALSPQSSYTPVSHGPREGAEININLTASQKKLRDKLLGSGGGESRHYHSTNGNGARRALTLEKKFSGASPAPTNGQYRAGVPRNISTYNDTCLSPSSLISGVTNFTSAEMHPVRVEDNKQQKNRVEIDRSDLPPFHDRAKMFGLSSSNPPPRQVPHGHADGALETDTSNEDMGYEGGLDYSKIYRGEDEALPEPIAQYRSSWMLSNRKTTSHSDAGGKYMMSYLDKPSGIVAVPPKSTRSAPGIGRRNSNSSADDVLDNVMDRVRVSMRETSEAASKKAPPLPPPRARSVSPRMKDRITETPHSAANSIKLRHRSQQQEETNEDRTMISSGIVFGAPDTFGAAAGDDQVDSQAPTIRDRARALEGWMGGKGVAIEREVRPTAGYSNDDMYQNSYLRRTSPHVTARKTIEGARASLTPPRPAGPNITATRNGKRSEKKSGPPSFLSSAIEAWSKEDLEESPDIENSTQTLPVANGTITPGSIPLQEARPTQENSAPPAPPFPSSTSDGLRDKKDAFVQPVIQKTKTDDMMFLKTWSKARGTPRKEAMSPESESSNPGSPDPFAQQAQSFSDEFGQAANSHGGAWPAIEERKETDPFDDQDVRCDEATDAGDDGFGRSWEGGPSSGFDAAAVKQKSEGFDIAFDDSFFKSDFTEA